MPSVGTAYVNVRVDTKGFEASLESMLNRLSKKMEAQGTQLGKDFERGLKKTDWGSAFSGMSDAANKESTKAANSLKKVDDQLGKTATSADRAGSSIDSALGKATSKARDATRDMAALERSTDGVARSARRVDTSGIGGGSGNIRAAANDAGFFGRKLNELTSEASRGTAILNGLFNTAAFGGSALGALAGGLSAAAQGIFAIGANAASATPALGIFANGLMSLAQVGSVIGISMHGVGEAIGAGFKAVAPAAAGAAKATGGLGKATAAASRAVRDAKQNLKDAYADAARAAEDAARRTLRAEQALASSQRTLLTAQRALNAARAEGLKQLRDIAFASEDAALAEQRASFDLEDAYAQLQAVSELSPDNRARQEAELAYQEAELHLRETKAAREDADDAQKQANKDGLEGTDAVRDARQDIADAQRQVADSTRDLADARREEAQTAIDNAKRIRDAQQAVADAQRALGDAQKGTNAAMTAGAKAADAYATALAKLSPEQREFVEKLISMKGRFTEMRNAVAAPIFTSLTAALDTLNRKGPDSKSFFDTVQAGLVGTSEELATTIDGLAHLAASDVFQGHLSNAMDSNNQAIGNFGTAVINLTSAFVRLADAAGPTFVAFSEWVAEVTKVDSSTGKMRKTVEDAAVTVNEWWDLIVEVGRSLKIFGGAANDAMNDFNDGKGYIPTLTANLKLFNDQLDRKELAVGFGQALLNFNAAAAAVKNVLDPLIKMGQDKGLQTAFDTIAKSDAFDRLGDTATDAAPALADLAVSIADILASLSESGAIDHFLTILSKVADVLAGLASGAAGSGVLKITGYITGALAATRLLWKVFKIGASPFVGLSKGIGTFLGNIATAKKSGKGLFSSLGSGFKGIFKGGGGAKIAGAGEEATDKTWQAEILAAVRLNTTEIVAAIGRAGLAGAVGGGGGSLASRVPVGGAGALGGIGAGAAGEVGKVGKFAGVMGKFSKVLGPAAKLMKPLSLGIRALGAAFRFALGPIGLIVFTVLPLLWPLLVKLEEKTGIFSKTLAALSDAFQWLWDKAKPALQGLADAIGWFWDKVKGAFNWIKDNWKLLLAILIGPVAIAAFLINKYWDGIKNAIQTAVGAIKNFFTGMWSGITAGLSTAWSWVVAKWDAIRTAVSGWKTQLGKSIGNIWGRFTSSLSAAWTWVATKWGAIKTAVTGWRTQLGKAIGNIWGKFTSSLADAWTWIGRKWGAIRTAVTGWKNSLGRSIGNIWGKFYTAFTDAWTWITNKWGRIKAAVKLWPSQIAGSLNKIWNGMGSGLISAVNWVGTKVNWLIGKINAISDKFNGPNISVSWPKLKWTGYATGGPVRGPGGPKSDSIPARLSNGEHVLTAAEVRAMGGHKRVSAMRQSALRGGTDGTGGLWDTLSHAASTVGSALTHGAQWAIKWAFSRFDDMIPNNFIGKFVGAGVKNIASTMTAWGKKKDEAEAKKKGGKYTGPPGGWTYPLGHRYGITQYPNSGHNPSWSVDIGAPGGTQVRAASRGVVRSAISLGNRSYGNYIVINHAGGQSSLYAHLRSFAVKAGQAVKTGQTIGYSDSTGHSTGNHLHFELRPSSSTIAAMAAHGVKLGSGGVVASSAAGTLALIAEAGKSERVTPLDSEGFTPAERQMLDTLQNNLAGNGGGDHYHVHPSERMDETALADKVVRRVTWNRRKGAGSR